jgi:hypothetical protein
MVPVKKKCFSALLIKKKAPRPDDHIQGEYPEEEPMLMYELAGHQ